MGCGRAVLCVIFPPLAVIDRGCGTVLIVLLLTLAGWIPGAMAALILNYQAANYEKLRRQGVPVPSAPPPPPQPPSQPPQPPANV